MNASKLGAFVESRRREISESDRQLVKELAIRELSKTRLTLDQLVARKVHEFQDLAVAGGKLWDVHFKAEWLKGTNCQSSNTNEPNAVRFIL